MPQVSVRDALLAAGAVEFQQHGYNATGIAALAARAGAQKGSFYNHFASKEVFAVEVIRGYARDARLDLLASGAGTPRERIHAHFTLLGQHLEQRGHAYGCLLGNFAAEATADNPQIREVVDQCFTGWTGALAAVIAEAWATSSDAPQQEDPQVAAAFLIDAWEGALMRGKAADAPPAVPVFLDFALRRILPA